MSYEMENGKYWYEFHISECVLCGRSGSYKERVHDRPKPDDPQDRYKQDSQWACDDHYCITGVYK